MNIPQTRSEYLQSLIKIELKSKQFRELSRDERFVLFLKRLEDSWTYAEMGFGVK